ncbi:MAG: hypothetical protein L0215_17580 [Gemmataceae bacterium]|nr:hypothetical protein [Gemmataceae bacterium]
MRNLKKLLLTAVAAVATLFAVASPADADFRFSVTSGGTGSVITDGAASDNNPVVLPPNGIILYTNLGSTLPGFTIQTNTNTAQPPVIINPGAFAAIDMTNSTVSSAAGGTLILFLQLNGITAGAGPLTVTSDVGGTLSGPGTVTFESFANGGNLVPIVGGDVGNGLGAVGAVPAFAIPGGSTPVVWNVAGNPTSVTFGPGAFSATGAAGFVAGTPYSLFARVTITFTGAGSVTFDHMTSTVPAPAALMLAATSLPFLAVGWLRRRKAQTQNA